MATKVRITVAGGRISTQAEGYVGIGCEKDVEFFSKALGGEQREAEHTAEYFETPMPEQERVQ
jgi:hypothetical protein